MKPARPAPVASSTPAPAPIRRSAGLLPNGSFEEYDLDPDSERNVVVYGEPGYVAFQVGTCFADGGQDSIEETAAYHRG